MKNLAVWSTSVLVTSGLIVYLEAFPINANNYTRYKDLEKLKQEQFTKEAIKQLIGNHLLDRFRSRSKIGFAATFSDRYRLDLISYDSKQLKFN